MGSYFLVAVSVTYAGVWIFALRPIVPWWQAVLIEIPIAFVSVGLGKLSGLLLAKIRLRIASRQLRLRVGYLLGQTAHG